jgi:ribonucleoside-diphosphate reductase alpha chain
MNADYIMTTAIMQKYVDQGISGNEYYNPKNYEDGKIPASELIENLISHYYYGTKQLYYCNTLDDDSEDEESSDKKPVEEDCDGCKI